LNLQQQSPLRQRRTVRTSTTPTKNQSLAPTHARLASTKSNAQTLLYLRSAPHRKLHASALSVRARVIDFFSWTKRLLRPAFSDYAHFSFLTFFLCFFQCEVRYPSTPYLHVTLPILRLGYSGRFIRPIVCLVPGESDSNSAYSAGAVAARRQNGVAVPQRASARGVVHST